MTIVKGQKRSVIDPKARNEKVKELRKKISKLEDKLHPDWSCLEFEGSAQAQFLIREYEEELRPQYTMEKEMACKELRELLAFRP